MSVQALNWAFKQQIDKSAAKFVLVSLANFANEEGRCYPSVATLQQRTGMDRKTVIAALATLCADGWIEDTGDRCGATHQIKVYRLRFERTDEDRDRESCQQRPPATSSASVPNRPKNGTVKASQKRNSTKNGTVPDFPSKSPVFPIKESQIWDTEPLEEPIEEPSERVRTAATPKAQDPIPTRSTLSDPSKSVPRPAKPAPSKPVSLPENWQPDAETLVKARKARDDAGLPPIPERQIPKVITGFRLHKEGISNTRQKWDAEFCRWFLNERIETPSLPAPSPPAARPELIPATPLQNLNPNRKPLPDAARNVNESRGSQFSITRAEGDES